MKHQIKEEISGITLFVSAIWVIFLVDLVLPVDFNNLGLIPRDLWGSAGIFTMPFLHGGWGHLIGNSIPLIILLCLLAGSQANSAKIVLQIIILGGVLLWLFGLPGKTHVGASGLIYGLITFLIVAGFREGHNIALVDAIVDTFMYNATLLKGVLPITVGQNVSWEGHLAGAIAGAIIAYASSILITFFIKHRIMSK